MTRRRSWTTRERAETHAGALLLTWGPAWGLALGLASGCAREPAPPDAGGVPCDADVQCRVADAGAEPGCGPVRACVAGRCERVDVDAGRAAGASGWRLDCPPADAAASGQ